MAKIMLFGSSGLNSVSQNIEEALLSLYNQGHEFIVGDCKGADAAFQMSLSRIGALERTTVYCMDKSRNNKYGAKEKVFLTAYDENTKIATIYDKDTSEIMLQIENISDVKDILGTREYYEFKDRKMIDECAIGICMWDGNSKGTMHNIQLLGIKDKPCYTYKF